MANGKKIGVLISGRGSNLAALIEACAAEDYPARIGAVISSRPDAAGLQFAEQAGVPAVALDHKDYDSREAFEAELDATLKKHGIELVCLAGFMRLLTAGFVEAWRDHLINIHPSLLPAYPGVNIHDRVADDGVRITGCTVHYVRTDMDKGPIIAQCAVPVLSGDTAETVAARVLEAEHMLYPLALRMVADGTVRVSGERVMFTGKEAEAPPLFSPLRA
ncbi:MAG: phosphoribosylglycinamide formyltransferase [Hyphomicrobiales bacterium]